MVSYPFFVYNFFPNRFILCLFFFSSRRRHTRSKRDWSSDVCSSDLKTIYHFVLSFVVFSIILIITGQEPFVFYRENTEVIIKTIENPISEAVMGTLIGFYGGSYIIFEVTRIYIREKWPAQFHEKIARFLEKVSS